MSIGSMSNSSPPDTMSSCSSAMSTISCLGGHGAGFMAGGSAPDTGPATMSTIDHAAALGGDPGGAGTSSL